MPQRHLVLGGLLLVLAGCADPPGRPVMLPLNYGEQSKAEAAYKRVQPELQQIDGVLKSYLSANNNPRTIVVIVSKEGASGVIQQKYPAGVDGMRIETQKQFSDLVPDEGIQPVKTVEQPKGWWNQVLFFLQNAPAGFWGGKKPN